MPTETKPRLSGWEGVMALSLWRLWPRVSKDDPIDDWSIPATCKGSLQVAAACPAPDVIDERQIWPDDPDEVPTWVLRAEQLRAVIGIHAPLPARTKREWWQQVDLAEMTVAQQLTPTVETLAPPLPHGEAARRFLGAIQDDEIVGEYTALELTDRYLAWCASERLTPTHVDTMKAELALLPGVHKRVIDRRDPATKVRSRIAMWVITPLAELGSMDEDERLAA